MAVRIMFFISISLLLILEAAIAFLRCPTLPSVPKPGRLRTNSPLTTQLTQAEGAVANIEHR
jgi:hypothetical protein